MVVLLLAAGGDYVNAMLKAKAETTIDIQSDEDADADADQTVLTSQIFNSLVQLSHIIFHSDLIFEFDLPEVKKTNAHSVIDTALNFTKYYRTLFRSIISPNAP